MAYNRYTYYIQLIIIEIIIIVINLISIQFDSIQVKIKSINNFDGYYLLQVSKYMYII